MLKQETEKVILLDIGDDFIYPISDPDGQEQETKYHWEKLSVFYSYSYLKEIRQILDFFYEK